MNLTTTENGIPPSYHRLLNEDHNDRPSEVHIYGGGDKPLCKQLGVKQWSSEEAHSVQRRVLHVKVFQRRITDNDGREQL